MWIQLVAVGQKMPSWVTAGYDEYAKRLPRDCALRLREIPAGKRSKSADIHKIVADEGERMLNALASGERVIALDLGGQEWSTPQLAERLAAWRAEGRNVSLLVGGPDGLAPQALARADSSWRLSALTLPHPLVRVLVAEQLYRAWTLLQNHPYHR